MTTDFPKYTRDDDQGDWISQVEELLKFHNIGVDDCVTIAALNLRDHFRIWYKILSESVDIMNWRQFRKAMLSRFGPNDYDNCFRELTKLQQTGSMQKYLKQFEMLLSKTNGLPNDQLVATFVSGLKQTISVEVEVLNPIN